MRGQILPDGGHSDYSPPEGVSVAVEVSPAPGAHSVLSRGRFGMKQEANLYLLAEIHEVAGEDEAEEADVEGGDEFLTVDVDHGAQEAPGAALSVHMQHPGMILIISSIYQFFSEPEDLEEPDSPHSGGCGHVAVIAGDQDKDGGRHHHEV